MRSSGQRMVAMNDAMQPGQVLSQVGVNNAALLTVNATCLQHNNFGKKP
jgi:hypothetical protein